MRSGAGTGYKIIGQLSKGTEVNITGTKTGTDKKKWYAIKYKGKTGYVSSRYITLKSASGSQSSGSSAKIHENRQHRDGQCRSAQCEAVRNRCKIMGQLSKGTEVSITEPRREPTRRSGMPSDTRGRPVTFLPDM